MENYQIQWAPEGIQHYADYVTFTNSEYLNNPSSYPEKMYLLSKML